MHCTWEVPGWRLLCYTAPVSSPAPLLGCRLGELLQGPVGGWGCGEREVALGTLPCLGQDVSITGVQQLRSRVASSKPESIFPFLLHPGVPRAAGRSVPGQPACLL